MSGTEPTDDVHLEREYEVTYAVTFTIPHEGEPDPEVLAEQWAECAHQWLASGGSPSLFELVVRRIDTPEPT
jgi:hypothetical protein